MSLVVEANPTVVVVQEPTGVVVIPFEQRQVIEIAGVVSAGGSGEVWTIGSPLQSADGIRTQFTTPTAFVSGQLVVFLNGLNESHFTENSTTAFSFETAPFAGDEISLLYQLG